MNEAQKKLKDLLHFEKFKIYRPDKGSGMSLTLNFTTKNIGVRDISADLHQFINVATEEGDGIKYFKGGKNNSIFFLYITTCDVSENEIIGVGYAKDINANFYNEEDCLTFLEFLARKPNVS